MCSHREYAGSPRLACVCVCMCLRGRARSSNAQGVILILAAARGCGCDVASCGGDAREGRFSICVADPPCRPAAFWITAYRHASVRQEGSRLRRGLPLTTPALRRVRRRVARPTGQGGFAARRPDPPFSRSGETRAGLSPVFRCGGESALRVLRHGRLHT